MTHLAVADARRGLSDILNRVVYGGERVVITRHGKDVAAIVSSKDLEALEKIEDMIDVTEAEKRLSEGRKHAIPYEAIRREMGLS
ncbi:MAG: type II toxin-antitoxin system Phd/YefM family antitoxin [Chitinispirillaceae bacterium]|nr:type II toxin-antitoxin system Phd/YefM family antitoxin [Chitinispirillaceae bacterium]